MQQIQQSMSPNMLVAYVAAAIDEIASFGSTDLQWAVSECIDQLEAEQSRLSEAAPTTLPPRAAALSRSLGPSLALSDLLLRGFPPTLDAMGKSPSQERLERVESLAAIVQSLRDVSAGRQADVSSARIVFEEANDRVVGRRGQSDII